MIFLMVTALKWKVIYHNIGYFFRYVDDFLMQYIGHQYILSPTSM